MIFSRLTFDEEFDRYSVSASLLEVSPGHWFNQKYLSRLPEKLLLDLISKSSHQIGFYDILNNDNLRLSLFSWMLSICKDNKRISNISFFKENDQNLIILIISDIHTFEPDNFLKRRIKFSFPKLSTNLNLIDITSEENRLLENKERTLPQEWSFLNSLTEEFNNYKYLMID